MQLRLGLFLDQLQHLFDYPVCFFCLLLHIFFERSSLLLIRFSSLTLASSNFDFVEVLYSSSKSFWSRTSFLNCLFSFSNSTFLCSKARSVETSLTLIFDNQLMFSSLGCIHVGIKSVAFLSLKLRGICTQVLSTCTSFRLLSTPFSHS